MECFVTVLAQADGGRFAYAVALDLWSEKTKALPIFFFFFYFVVLLVIVAIIFPLKPD